MNKYQEQLLALMKAENIIVTLRDKAMAKNDSIAYKWWCGRLENLHDLMERIREGYMEGR